MNRVRPLVSAVQRFVVEQVRDTRLSVLRRPAAPTLARPRLGERLELWWASQELPSRVDQLQARARQLTSRLRR